LAAEKFEELNEVGVATNLKTGDDEQIIDGATHVSCTVEMVDLTKEYDCLVLDEVQFAADSVRGFAWTRVLLGSVATEIHCCGEPAAEAILRQIADLTGDKFEVLRYERLSPLNVEEKPLKSLSRLKPGDAVVTFTRRQVFQLKRKIESLTSYRVSVLYGSLPPSVRMSQANAFNEDSKENNGILVATDCIGWGLNLNINRVIFTSLRKFDGRASRSLTPSEIKQVGGRAGRKWNAGCITAATHQDLQKIRKALLSKASPLESFRVSPMLEHLEVYEDQYSLPEMLELFQDYYQPERLTTRKSMDSNKRNNNIFSMSDLGDRIDLSQHLEEIHPLSFSERYVFSMAPCDIKSESSINTFKELVRKYASGSRRIECPHVRIISYPRTIEELKIVEQTFQILTMFSWLGYHFRPFERGRKRAQDLLRQCVEIIDESVQRL